MRKLLLIIFLIPFTANSQTWVYDTTFFNNGQYILVKKNPATSIVPTTTRLADTAAAIRTTVNGKLSTNGNGSALTGLTKAQVGLSNADNTSDISKPISTLQLASIAAKATGGSVSLTNNFTTSSVTAVSTNLSFAIAASEIYDVTITGTCSKATTATGLKFVIAAPTGCTIKGIQLSGGATLAAPLIPSIVSAINTLGATLSTGIGVEVCFTITFRVVNSSTPGNITLQAATVTSNVATVYAGTKMTYIKSVTL